MMRRRSIARGILLAAVVSSLAIAQDYSGPLPPKPDIPYLEHADNLVATEVTEAQENDRKNEIVYVIGAPASPARTPLAEPMFIMQAENVAPERLELYKLEVKGGNRQIEFPKKRKKNAPRPLRLSVTKLDESLYRIEANETLENGEYSLTPAGSNQVFCFQVY